MSIESYKSIKHRSFPNKFGRSFAVKDQDYYLTYLRAMLYAWTSGNGESEIKYKSSRLDRAEKYATGEQGSESVKDKLLRKRQDGKYYGKMRKVFETYDVLPEMLGVISAINMRQDYTVSAVATDEESSSARELEKEKIKYLLDKETRDTLDKLGYKPEVNLTEEELNNYTESDIDALFSSGGLQLEREINAMSAIRTSMRLSQFKEIENECTNQLLKWGITAVRSYTDENTKEVKFRNVDIKNLIIRSSKDKQFRNSPYFGEVIWMTLNEIRDRVKTLDVKDVEKILEASRSHSINKDFFEYEGRVNDALGSYMSGTNGFLGDIKIPVLDAQWLDDDIRRKKLHPIKSGGYREEDMSYDQKLKRREVNSGAKSISRNFIKKYDALWVIGTDILISYGQSKGAIYYGRKGNKSPRLDISVIKTGQKSLVERCIPHVDDINLATTKLRSALAMMPPPVMLHIYEHALRNVKMNGKEMKAEDLVRNFFEDGILISSGRDENGNYIMTNGGKGVEVITPSTFEIIASYSNEITTYINRMRQVLGLPEGLDGTSGPAYQGLGVKEMVAAASSNALFPVLSRIQPLIEYAFDPAIRQWQALCIASDLSLQDIVLGERTARMFMLDKDFSNHEFNISLQYAPNDDEKQFLIEQIASLNTIYAQSEGRIGISKSEFLLIYKLIKAGRVDEAMRTLAENEKMREKINIQLDQARIEANAETQENAAIVAQEQQRETLREKGAQERQSILLKESLSNVGDLQLQEVKNLTDDENVSQEEVSALTDDTVEQIISRILPIMEETFARVQANQAQEQISQEQQGVA